MVIPYAFTDGLLTNLLFYVYFIGKEIRTVALFDSSASMYIILICGFNKTNRFLSNPASRLIGFIAFTFRPKTFHVELPDDFAGTI